MSKFITVYEFTWIILGTASTVKEGQGSNARDEPNNKWLRLAIKSCDHPRKISLRAYLAAKKYFLVLVLFYSKNTDVAQHPKPWLPASHPSCKLTVRAIAARGATALASQFPTVLLQICLEILLLLHIVAGLPKKNKLSLTSCWTCIWGWQQGWLHKNNLASSHHFHV